MAIFRSFEEESNITYISSHLSFTHLPPLTAIVSSPLLTFLPLPPLFLLLYSPSSPYRHCRFSFTRLPPSIANVPSPILSFLPLSSSSLLLLLTFLPLSPSSILVYSPPSIYHHHPFSFSHLSLSTTIIISLFLTFLSLPPSPFIFP